MFKGGLTNHGIKDSFTIGQPVTYRDHVRVCVVNKFMKNYVGIMLGFARISGSQIEHQTVGRLFDDLRVVFRIWVRWVRFKKVGQDRLIAICESGYASPFREFFFASVAAKARPGLLKRSQT